MGLNFNGIVNFLRVWGSGFDCEHEEIRLNFTWSMF